MRSAEPPGDGVPTWDIATPSRCGRANWWLPRWLDRRLPHLAIEAPAAEQSVRVPESAVGGQLG